MKQYLLVIIVSLLLCSFKDDEPYGIYREVGDEFFYQLKLNKNATFEYDFSSSHGSTSSKGKWKILKDTLYLFDYEKPCIIKQLEESRVDSLGNNSIVEVISYSAPNSNSNSNSDNKPYIDGVHTNFKLNSNTQKDTIADFPIWINDDCDNIKQTDKLGRIKFKNERISKISFEYDSYKIKDPKNNYFILTLSVYPIYRIISPPTLRWTKLVVAGDNLIPLECNKQQDYSKLKKITTN